ncbi:MAG: hypothetical protein K2U26_01510 [Cyclobacteriaceae bacterium]|nr:hypothetical protein [Cyclobacteriaceae bacterium]
MASLNNAKSLLILNINIVNEWEIKRQDIFIKRQLIEDIGNLELGKYSDAEVIDGTGKYLNDSGIIVIASPTYVFRYSASNRFRENA